LLGEILVISGLINKMILGASKSAIGALEEVVVLHGLLRFIMKASPHPILQNDLMIMLKL
jgi:hypothetical protein